MRLNQWSAPSRKREYMQDVAERVHAGFHQPVRTDPVGFLLDLESAGLLKLSIQVTMPLSVLRSAASLSTRSMGPDAEQVIEEFGTA
jgi:hypothetical protein